MTLFSAVYNCFLGKITDDMYLELTPLDTLKDLQNLLVAAIPGFEFPRVNIRKYNILVSEIAEDLTDENDFIIGTAWEETDTETKGVLVDRSYFEEDLTEEEINILALLMKQGWVQRQLTSIENTRMKYSGTDFKFTSQANHFAKLQSLLEESRRDSFHMQRLYKRRKIDEEGRYASNWSIFNSKS